MSTALKRRTRLLGLGVILAACTLVGTGCGVVEDAASTAASQATRTPQEKLVAAAPTASTPAYTFTATSVDSDGAPASLKGTVDPAHKAFEMSTTVNSVDPVFTMTMQFRVVDQKSWVKIKFTDGPAGLPDLPEGWMQIDAAKVKDKDSIPVVFRGRDVDLAGSSALFAAIVSATAAGDGKYTGTLDLSRAKAPEVIEVVNADQLAALGAKSKSIPFTATVDGDGRVTNVAVQVPAAGKSKAFTHELTYTYAGAAPIAAPAASEVDPTPTVLYDLLNG